MNRLALSFSILLTVSALAGCGHAGNQRGASAAQPVSLEEVRAYALGEWESLSVELRPAEDRTGTGKVQSTRLKRHFTYLDGDRFTGRIRLFADDGGQAPLMEFEFRGHLRWGGPHPVAQGAYAVDYVLDEGFGVTPLHEQATAMLNQVRAPGVAEFVTGKQQDLLRKVFPLFNIAEGQVVMDYDLIYFRDGLLFMGAKHVDGTPFDRPERRPNQLQVPLARVASAGTP